MALELGDELAELDINPLMVLPRGQGAVALDALAVCGPGPDQDADQPLL
jgi:hypothetical protein